MLSPRYLDGLSDELIEIYSQLETAILQDMARRLARIGKVTDATKWQAQMLAEAGVKNKWEYRKDFYGEDEAQAKANVPEEPLAPSPFDLM